MRYILPIDICNTDVTSEKISIDMSRSEFDVPNDKQKRSSFIFLRNAGIKGELDFSDCTYDDKEEFLLLYFLEDIDVNADILSTTWLEILSAKDGGGVYLPSILTSDEIQQFLTDHSDLISEIYQLINSLPIYALYCSEKNQNMFNTDDFQKTDYNRIKMTNFSKLAMYNPFILLVNESSEPLFYEKLFIKGEFYISKMMSYLPYSNLLDMMTLAPEIQDDAINRINSLLVPPEIVYQEREEVTE